MTSSFNYLLTDAISALAIVASMIGLYFTEDVILQRARRRVLEAIGKNLPFPKFKRKKFNEELTESNYLSYHSVINRVPLTPIALLTGSAIIALGWNTISQKGFYAVLVNTSHIFIAMPFVVVIALLFITGSLLNSGHLSKRIDKRIKSDGHHLDWKLLYLLRLKRYELYFLFASIGIIFLILTKTFSYLIFYYPDFTIPLLPFLGTLKSYDPNGLGYALLTTFVLAPISYLLPKRTQKFIEEHCSKSNKDHQDSQKNSQNSYSSFQELENELLEKVSKSRLLVTVTDVGGSKFSGYVCGIGSVLGICGVESAVDSDTNKNDDNNNCNVKYFVRWNYVTSVEFKP